MALLDRRLRYKAINPYLASAHGSPIESHLGKHVREILGPVSEQVERALLSVLATSKPVCGVEVAGQLRGSVRWHWIVNYFPIVSSDGMIKELGAVALEVPKNVQPWFSPQESPDKGEVIRSWKDIAEYVGACVKTVQRWEQIFGFPVRRLSHNKGATVFALTNEIDEWLNRTSRLG